MSQSQAIKSRRVAAALYSVQQHIKSAINLTQIEGVGTAVQKLIKTPLPPVPAVTAVQPDEIDYEDRAESGNITVTGENLEGVHEVLLIHRDDVAPWSASADEIQHLVGGKSFTAHIDKLASAPAGHYNLLLINDAGQTTLATDVFTINPPAESGKRSGKERGLQLGGIYPNGSIQGTTIPAIVVALKGRPTEFYVTDMDGNEQSDWSVEMVQKKDEWGSRFGWRANHVNAHVAEVQKLFPENVGVVLLIIQIPKGLVKGGECRQIFQVVGKSTHPEAEDALAFFVRRDLKHTD